MIYGYVAAINTTLPGVSSEWMFGNLRDRWLIKIKGAPAHHAEDTSIQELT